MDKRWLDQWLKGRPDAPTVEGRLDTLGEALQRMQRPYLAERGLDGVAVRPVDHGGYPERLNFI